MAVLATLETRGGRRCTTYTPRASSTSAALSFLPMLLFFAICFFVRLLLLFPHLPFVGGVVCPAPASAVATDFHI
jgi:hypothetical protein